MKIGPRGATDRVCFDSRGQCCAGRNAPALCRDLSRPATASCGTSANIARLQLEPAWSYEGVDGASSDPQTSGMEAYCWRTVMLDYAFIDTSDLARRQGRQGSRARRSCWCRRTASVETTGSNTQAGDDPVDQRRCRHDRSSRSATGSSDVADCGDGVYSDRTRPSQRPGRRSSGGARSGRVGATHQGREDDPLLLLGVGDRVALAGARARRAADVAELDALG